MTAVTVENGHPLKVGDRVRLSGSHLNITGVVVAVLPDGYVRVQWSDLSGPTTHRPYSVDVQNAIG
ncbi:MAG: hypothetical protein QM808_08565 [Steroidobacteraceae bacterium]